MANPQESTFQLSRLRSSPHNQHVKHVLSLLTKGDERYGVQASIRRTLLSIRSVWDALEPSSRTRRSSRRKLCVLEQLTNSAWENLGSMTPPLREGAIMDMNSSLNQLLILAQTSDAGDLHTASARWACCALGPQPHTILCFQTPVLTPPVPQALLIGNSGPKTKQSACPPEEKHSLWGCSKATNEDQPARPLAIPQLHRLL